MIEAQALVKTYRNIKVLDGVTFQIPRNHVLAVAGANGAGKTTLLKLLSLILRPDSGRILIDGEDTAKNNEAIRGKIGYVPQTNAFFEELTVRENMEYWRTSGSVAHSAELMGLDDALNRKVSTLSGGMQRRVNLALGIINSPDLIIMDEPLTGVDIATRAAILGWIKSLKGRGLTVVYSTHHTDEIAGVADDLLVLRNGAVASLSQVGGADGEKIAGRILTEFI